MKKGGWDCARHYEILMNGCIPYFIDIEKCPENTMINFPKEVIKESNVLFNYLVKKYDINENNNSIENITEDDLNKINKIIIDLLNYSKKYLTTEYNCKYILEKTNNKNAKKILFISNPVDSDYLKCFTLHGFKEVFGELCHDYPLLPFIYKKCDANKEIDNNMLHGKGFTRTELIDIELHNFKNDISIEDDIKNQIYDLIIYSQIHKEKPLYNLIKENYSPEKIILLCGEDFCNHNDHLEFISGGNICFIREY